MDNLARCFCYACIYTYTVFGYIIVNFPDFPRMYFMESVIIFNKDAVSFALSCAFKGCLFPIEFYYNLPYYLARLIEIFLFILIIILSVWITHMHIFF